MVLFQKGIQNLIYLKLSCDVGGGLLTGKCPSLVYATLFYIHMMLVSHVWLILLQQITFLLEGTFP